MGLASHVPVSSRSSVHTEIILHTRKKDESNACPRRTPGFRIRCRLHVSLIFHVVITRKELDLNQEAGRPQRISNPPAAPAAHLP